jgi:hypothetical protein
MSMSSQAPQRPVLSIVVPTPSDTAALEETLVSILENRPQNCEIIVALGCEYDDPWNIREEVRFVQAPAGSSMVACANLGVASSRGEVIHILAAGWRASEGWTDAALVHFDDRETSAVVPLTVAADRRTVVAAGIRCTPGGRRLAVAPRRSRSTVDTMATGDLAPHGPALEAGFWRATFLAEAGPGFATACGDSCADADMAVAVVRSRTKAVVEPGSLVVGDAAERRRKRPFLAGLHAERLFWRSIAGQPVLLAVLRHLIEIVRHSVARGPFGTLPMLAGRFVALIQFGSYGQRYRQLRSLMQAATQRNDAAEPRTIRIDGPHTGFGRPRRAIVDQPLRKSA